VGAILRCPWGKVRQAARGNPGFQQGERVNIQWSISKEKILFVVAEVNGLKETAAFQSPLANEELTEEVLSMLKAKKAFNKSVLDGHGRPTANVTLAYATAAKRAGNWRLAAEMLEVVERLDQEADHSTNICYCYSMDGDNKSSYKWSEIAYVRKPSAITAYNHALDKWRNQNMPAYEQLMQECLKHDSKYTSALVSYGEYLMEKGDPLGIDYLQRAFDIFKGEMKNDELDSSDIPRFRQTAKALGKEEILSAIGNFQTNIQSRKKVRAFSNENLVRAIGSASSKSGLL